MSPFNNNLIISKLFIILYHSYCCYVNTLYNLFAHSSFTFLLILIFIKFCTFNFTFYSLFFTSFLFNFVFFHTYIYIYFLVFVFHNNCTVLGADLTYISLMVIYSLHNRVCDEYKSWILKIQIGAPLQHFLHIAFEGHNRRQWRPE